VIQADKSCGVCSTEIDNCEFCHENDGIVQCQSCAFDDVNDVQLMPSYDHLVCNACNIDEWDNAGTCTLCSDEGVSHCGRCEIDGTCQVCYGNLFSTLDDTTGAVTACECARTQFLDDFTSNVADDTICIACNDYVKGGILDCIICDLVDSSPVCTECIDPLFVDAIDGFCTTNSCQLDSLTNGECTQCNSRDNLVFYP